MCFSSLPNLLQVIKPHSLSPTRIHNKNWKQVLNTSHSRCKGTYIGSLNTVAKAHLSYIGFTTTFSADNIVVVPSLIPRPCPAFHPLQCGKVHMGESLVSFHMWLSDVCVGAQNSERQGYQLARGDCHSDWQTNNTSQMVWWCTVDHCLSGYHGTRPWWNSQICESIIMQIGSTMYHY